MKIFCTSCSRTIPAADIALDKGWAKCRACDEVFPLADVLPDYGKGPAIEVVPERPFDARAVLRRDAKQLAIHVPAHGIGPAAFGLLAFATFWLAFVTFWTLAALGVFFNGGKPDFGNAWFAAFSIPFWCVGFGMLAGVSWIARGTKNILIDAGEAVTETRCLAYRRTKRIGRDRLQCARAAERQTGSSDNAKSSPTAELVYTGGAFGISCVNTAEQAWLVAEINDFLREVPYEPSARGAGWDTSTVARNESF